MADVNTETPPLDYRKILDERLVRHPPGLWDVRSTLRHFALINYALPAARLARYIPTDRFLIPEFNIGGQRLAMLSVVPFWDEDFRFIRLAPFLKFRFGQTNHRVYVIDRATGQHAAWFFGTTLGSPVVHIARNLWRIPWHPARYAVNCRYNTARRAYDTFAYRIGSDWCSGEVRIRDTGAPVTAYEGFDTPDALRLILTHPITGYYRRLDGRLGTYAVWHREFDALTVGEPEQLYFSLYERLGLLSRAEMARPQSIFLCPTIEFDVHLPPRPLDPAR